LICLFFVIVNSEAVFFNSNGLSWQSGKEKVVNVGKVMLLEDCNFDIARPQKSELSNRWSKSEPEILGGLPSLSDLNGFFISGASEAISDNFMKNKTEETAKGKGHDNANCNHALYLFGGVSIGGWLMIFVYDILPLLIYSQNILFYAYSTLWTNYRRQGVVSQEEARADTSEMSERFRS
jgi:hypothetical protein